LGRIYAPAIAGGGTPEGVVMDEENYWQRLAARRLSRRRLLVGAAGVGSGLAASSLAGCGGGNEDGSKATPDASPRSTGEPSETGTPAATPMVLEPAKTRGGKLRWFSWHAMPLDTLDPHQSQLGPLFSVHSAVFSKVLQYDDAYEGTIGIDLAEAMPETPDGTTFVVKIAPDIHIHDTDKIRKQFPDTAGRQLTAEDVKYSIERQVNKQSLKSALYYRAYQWETVDKIEVVDPLTLRITTKKPTATMFHALADTNAFIIPKELVDPQTDDMNSVDKMVGSGPWILERLSALQVVSFVRNPDWFAKDRLADQGLTDRPFLDGYEVPWTPQDDTAIEAAFATKQIDWAGFTDQTNVDRVAADLDAWITEEPQSGFPNSRLLIADSPGAVSPFKDLRLRQAISMAADRNRLGQLMWQKWFLLGSPVGQACQAWALPLDQLSKKPGYRFRREERDADLAEARRLWEAAGGLDIGTVQALYAGIPDWTKNAWPPFQKMMADNLGLNLQGKMDATGVTEIAQAALQKTCLFSFSYDNGYSDLDDWVYPYFHSTGNKNSFNLNDPALDQMLDAQRAEFNGERRRQLGYEIQNYLLDNVVARLDWVAQIWRGCVWSYVRNYSANPWYGRTFKVADYWLDSTDPSYEGRPA
jgi:ABC-type transport system substrate-binding protein